MEKYDPQFMEKAIRLAEENIFMGNGGPFGAVIVKDGQIIATAINEVTSTVDPTAHAEVVAIRKACSILKSYQLEGCEIYSSCEPCPMCLGAIYWARPSAVFYAASKEDAAASGFDDEFIYKEIECQPDKRKIPFINKMRDEARDVFRRWNESERKVKY
ncbi:MAG: nucleoside deaminase [Bacteroidales bacterium]|nr:nucleoside deaminase [Bacteroidales bacterium]